MFLAQAHSFTQQARLAITLAWVAGCTNIISVLALGTVTSHVTGVTSQLGLDVATGQWSKALFLAVVLLSFFLGASLSGTCTELGRRRGWPSIYVLPIMLQTFALATFAFGLELYGSSVSANPGAVYWLTTVAAAAMGLQNATITRISSGVVRTTHVTGVVTDLGLELVQFLLWLWDRRQDAGPDRMRAVLHSVRHHPTPKRLALLASIFGSFALGAAFGAVMYGSYPRWAMFAPVLLLLWIIRADVKEPIAELELSDLVSADSGLDLPEIMSIYHLRRKDGKKATQLPDLMSWTDRLPATVKVVVLDLGLDARFDEQALLELRAAIHRMRLTGRRLILGGISNEMLPRLRAVMGRDIGPDDFCQDFDIAVAHAMNVAEAMAAGPPGPHSRTAIPLS
jgi:uncharacterized membrane protein YoaK (UPF0700 family)